MQKIKLIWALLCLGYSYTASACSNCDMPLRWGFSGHLGFTRYDTVYLNDGQSVIGRLGINAQYPCSDLFALGIEVGGQNGNTMRLDIPKLTLDLLGGEPVSLTVKPMVDILGTLEVVPYEEMGLFGFIKGGVAYRQAQVGRNEVNDLSQTSPELQAGLGYKMNDNLALHVTYQQIFGNDPDYQVNWVTQTATIAHIPTQKSVLLGLSLII